MPDESPERVGDGIAAALGTVAVFGAVNFSAPAIPAQSDGWVTVVDGKEVGDWDKLGVANWRIADGALMADKLEGKDLRT